MIIEQWYSKTFKVWGSLYSELSYEVQANKAGADKFGELVYDYVTILQTE